MKTIVSKKEIYDDRNLSIIKDYRLVSKQISQLSTLIKNSKHDSTLIKQLNELHEKKATIETFAIEQYFHIWTNLDGSVGHDYSKDFEITSDAQNDYIGYLERLRGLE